MAITQDTDSENVKQQRETGIITEAEMRQPSSQCYFLIAQEILTARPSMSCIFPDVTLILSSA